MRIPVLSDILDLLLPPGCAACGTILGEQIPLKEPLCDGCRRALRANRLPARVENVNGVAVLAPYEYSFPLDITIPAAKGRGMPSLFDPLAGPMCDSLRAAGLSGYPQIVVPVPLHPSKRRQRGYDQACYLAGLVASRLGLPVANRAIRRIKVTPPQKWADRKERLVALDEAFAPGREGELVRKKRVLLVDDVVTTGATLAAAAYALHMMRPAGVLGFTAARTLLTKSPIENRTSCIYFSTVQFLEHRRPADMNSPLTSRRNMGYEHPHRYQRLRKDRETGFQGGLWT